MTEKTAHKYVRILGIRLDSTPEELVLVNIGKKLASQAQKDKFYIVTPNAEIVIQAQKDKKLADIINQADFSVPDGVGLKLFGDQSLPVIHGRNLMLKLFRLANNLKLKVFFITSDERSTNNLLLEKYKHEFPNSEAKAMIGPRLNIDGYPMADSEAKKEKVLLETINAFKPSLLFVCFGAPKQEKWIAKWLPKLNVTAAMAVGGGLDYYAGTESLPPHWMAKLELEWLWRLFTQPQRIKRILKAVVIFPLLIAFERFKLLK